MKTHQTKLLILAFLLAHTAPSLFSQKTPVAPTSPVVPPAITLVSKDSLFMEIEEAQKYVIHRVKTGQTLYRIAKFYHVNLPDLKSVNGIATENVEIGTVLKVPVGNKALIRARGKGFRWADNVKIYYRVKQGETLYKLSKTILKIPVDSLVRRNSLPAPSVSVGQILHIGWFPKAGVPDSLGIYAPQLNQTAKANQSLQARFESALSGKKAKTEEGAAFWRVDDRVTSEGSLFVMHNKAKLGSVMQVVNPRNGVILHVKVVGRIIPNPQAKNALVMVSPAVAKALGAVDPQFFVKLKYFM